MRRWNGWGETDYEHPLNPNAVAFLRQKIGDATPTQDASKEAVLQQVAASRLQLTGFSDDVTLRAEHARGQSYPDWLALRYGKLGPVADLVAQPDTPQAAQACFDAAYQAGAVIIPYGGGTSVVGHLQVPLGERPVVNISLAKLNRLKGLDERAHTARFEAGTPGPMVEAQLKRHGYLLGHFPQSYEYSTVGGWVVTRSSGQQSLRYGRIENLFYGGQMVTAHGVLDVGGVPASSAGPDLREWVMGSEGRLGLLTEATVRIRPIPASEAFYAVFFPTWDLGAEAVRQLCHADLGLSMLRLSNEVETETQLTLAGHETLITWLRRYLRLRSVGNNPVMLLIGVTGSELAAQRSKAQALALCAQYRGVSVGTKIGAGWVKNRFKGPYMRNSLWALGFGADTVETCVPWSAVTPTMRSIEKTATQVLAKYGEKVHVFSHLSHVYRQGCSVYSTLVFRAGQDYDRDLERWTQLKKALSLAMVAHGGTISHQHGVGLDHAPYLVEEKGALGLRMLRAVAQEFDPKGLLNPGKCFT